MENWAQKNPPIVTYARLNGVENVHYVCTIVRRKASKCVYIAHLCVNMHKQQATKQQFHQIIPVEFVRALDVATASFVRIPFL